MRLRSDRDGLARTARWCGSFRRHAMLRAAPFCRRRRSHGPCLRQKGCSGGVPSAKMPMAKDRSEGPRRRALRRPACFPAGDVARVAARAAEGAAAACFRRPELLFGAVVRSRLRRKFRRRGLPGPPGRIAEIVAVRRAGGGREGECRGVRPQDRGGGCAGRRKHGGKPPRNCGEPAPGVLQTDGPDAGGPFGFRKK